MTKENEKGWREEFPTALWTHKTQIISYKSLTFFPSLWHGGCHPNRFSKASSEVSKDSKDTQRRPLGD